jgi:hypothetical protein
MLHMAVLQVMFEALTVVVGYCLARRLLLRIPDLREPERLALMPVVIMGADPASVVNSATLV